MAHVDVEGPVGGVDECLAPGAVVLVALLHGARVPVRPVHRLLEHRQGEGVGQRPIVHRVAVPALQVRVPGGVGGGGGGGVIFYIVYIVYL